MWRFFVAIGIIEVMKKTKRLLKLLFLLVLITAGVFALVWFGVGYFYDVYRDAELSGETINCMPPLTADQQKLCDEAAEKGWNVVY